MNRWIGLVAGGLLALAAGCGPSDGPSAEQPAELVEASLAEQVKQVRSGEADRIQVEQTALTNDDLRALADLAGLRTLQIDHPESRITAAGLTHLEALQELSHLRLRGPGVDNAAMEEIARLQGLEVVNLPQGSFTDAGLAKLNELPSLVQLRFSSPNVTDAGMQSLAGFPTLKRLHLIDVPISDAGLAEIGRIEGLESLYIDGSKLSDKAWGDLFKVRSKLHVHVDQQHHDRDPHRHSHPH